MDYKKILFVGRWQPFHLGHLSVLKEIDNRQDVTEIIIGIGSAQYSGTSDNPYSFKQREKILNTALGGQLNKKFTIFAIPDVDNNDIWVEHVEKKVGDFDEVYTGNDLVKRLFQEKDYQVNTVNKQINISATKIREMITSNNEEWQKFVPANIVALIKEYERINK